MYPFLPVTPQTAPQMDTGSTGGTIGSHFSQVKTFEYHLGASLLLGMASLGHH